MSKSLISAKQESITSLEQTLQSELTEVEKRQNDALQAEANTKVEIEKLKKFSSTMKKRNESLRDTMKENETLANEKGTLKKEKETLAREKEELLRKNQALLKQIEDSKLSRINIGESSNEQTKKDQEKDTRIQEQVKLEEELGKVNHAIAVIVEMGRAKADASKKGDSKVSVKREAAEKPMEQPAKKAKAEKDPILNMPKRPLNAFFLFMEEFRKQFKAKNPYNKLVSAVGKAAGEKWKSMSAVDKAPYEIKAVKRKTEYIKTMIAYNKTMSDGASKKAVVKKEEEESNKSKSEVHDEDDDEYMMKAERKRGIIIKQEY